MLKKVIFGLAVCWTVMIAVLCLVRLNELPKIEMKSIDKYVHFAFHFGFTLVWGYYSLLKQNSIRIRKVLVIVVMSFLYGILIEFLQENFTTTRHADVRDVLANLTGAAVALIGFVLVKRFSKGNFSNN